MIVSDGKIQVFLENQAKPLAMAVDAHGALPIKYFGFASYENSPVTFFYNCKDDEAFVKAKINDQSALVKNGISSIDLRNCMWHTEKNQVVNCF